MTEREGIVSGSGRKTLIREYKETQQPAGIYRVRNTTAGKSLIGSSVNLPGMLNRQRFQLEHGSHPDRELQSDWKTLGPGAFEFEVLDRLRPRDEPGLRPWSSCLCSRLGSGSRASDYHNPFLAHQRFSFEGNISDLISSDLNKDIDAHQVNVNFVPDMLRMNPGSSLSIVSIAVRPVQWHGMI